MAVVADPCLLAAHSQLELARGLATSGDFGGAGEAYAHVHGQLHGVAAGVAEPELRTAWANFLRALQHERDLVAAWQAECAELEAWSVGSEVKPTEAHMPNSTSGQGGGGGHRAAAVFSVNPRSFEVQELAQRPAPTSAPADRDLDVWPPPEDAALGQLGVPLARERTRREREEAYERRRRESTTPGGAAGVRAQRLPGMRARVNSGAKRAPQPLPLDPCRDLDLFSGPDQELIQQLRRDVLTDVSGVEWQDIAGLEAAKGVLQEHLTTTFLYTGLFQSIPLLRPLKGVLLFGPPGTGKTMLAKAVASAGRKSDSRTHFINVSASTLASKYRGESEKLVRFLFDIARAHEPCVIFIDEVDSLCSARGSRNEHEASRRMKTELLTQIDGLHASSGGGAPRVMVLAATNFPWDIDEALRRRLEKRIYIPLPQLADRADMLRICLRGMAVAGDVDLGEVARRTKGYSGDDIANLVRCAADCVMRRIRRGRAPDSMPAAERAAMLQEIAAALTLSGIGAGDFREALQRTNPSCSTADIERHHSFAETFGCT